MNGIYWLASYPKSGNTWTRTLLTNYLGEKEVPADINALETDSIASSRLLFDDYVGLASSDLSEEQIHIYRPAVYKLMNKESERDLYMKVHDAFSINTKSLPLIPPSITKGVIYIIRNPHDVAVSYAHHNNNTIEHMVQNVCNETYTIARNKKDQAAQLSQLLLSWSGHVKSWADSGLNIHIMRYEDMKKEPFATFKAMLTFMDIEVDEDKLKQAIKFSNFEVLKNQEDNAGFKERSHKATSFFRKGEIGSYRDELNSKQIEKITKYHQKMMLKYGYLTTDNRLVY
jgi:hypothetical protein